MMVKVDESMLSTIEQIEALLAANYQVAFTAQTVAASLGQLTVIAVAPRRRSIRMSGATLDGRMHLRRGEGA